MKNENDRKPGLGMRPASWWACFFERAVREDWSIPWATGVALDSRTRAHIGRSIAEFQRGESSEARGYFAKSKRFSIASGDPAFHAASVAFIATENAHADLLLRFMNEVGIARRKSSLGDTIFRWLRSGGDLGWASRTLLVAELIAQEYYPSLGSVTSHPSLVRICQRVVAEEATHIRFQVERIVRVEAAVSRSGHWIREVGQRVLMGGAVCAVWLGHRKVLSSRLGFLTFASRCFERNARALADMARLRATGEAEPVVRAVPTHGLTTPL